MTVTLDLKPDLDARLRDLAQAQGLSVGAFLLRLIEQAVSAPRSEAATDLLAAWDEEDANPDPQELEARQRDWSAFKAALNADHSSDRILFP